MSEDDKSKFAPTPKGWQERWTVEITAAKENPAYKKYINSGERIIKRFRDEEEVPHKLSNTKTQHLNLFHANVTTVKAMLFGNIPKIEVDRRFADADDDVARVASVILQRMLNYDIQEEGEAYSEIMRNVLDDRLLPGQGQSRLVYNMSPTPDNMGVGEQWIETKYTQWKDFLWSPCRTWDECRWVAFRSYLTKEEVEKRFGKTDVPLNAKGFFNQDGKADVWSKSEIWEIWSKEDKKIYFFVDGYTEILEIKDDPYKIPDFYPCPKPFAANVTTTEFMPRADYAVAQDLYQQIDELQSRIATLTQAVKVAGVYDKNAGGLQRLLTEGVENQLIPVESWAALAEKQGLKGVIDWLPLEAVVNTLEKLIELREDTIRLLYQVTGMSDIMRGAESERRTSATEQSIKAKFASIRVQALQDEFARFASDLQSIKVYIIAELFTPENIVKYSNIMSDKVNAQFVAPAVEFIKSKQLTWRITVRPETLAMTDYAQLKQDRTEFINALAVFLQSAAPIVQYAPGSTPTLLTMLKWGLAGFKGSNEIEGALDQAISQLERAPPEQDKPDPKIEQMKMEMKQKQEEHQLKMDQSHQQFQLKLQQMQAAKEHDQEKFALEMQRVQAETDAKLAEIRMEMIQSFQEARLNAQKIQMERKDAASGGDNKSKD